MLGEVTAACDRVQAWMDDEHRDLPLGAIGAELAYDDVKIVLRAARQQAEARATSGAGELARDLRGILGNFERIAAKAPNDQPAYPDGVRPWGTGDLRHAIETLTATIAALSASPTEAPGSEGAGDREAGRRWIIGEARKTLRLVQGCMECNADDERRWAETIEWLEKLA